MNSLVRLHVALFVALVLAVVALRQHTPTRADAESRRIAHPVASQHVSIPETPRTPQAPEASALGPPPKDKRELMRELDYTETGPLSRDPVRVITSFRAQNGVNIPVDSIWTRYEQFLRVAAADFQSVASTIPKPKPWVETRYQQLHLGYPVRGFGYIVLSENGMFRSASGKVMPDLPEVLPTPMTLDAARAALVKALKFPGSPPWLIEPTKYRAPEGTLALTSRSLFPTPDDFVLTWCFDLGGSGLGSRAADIDAETGQLLRKSPSRIPDSRPEQIRRDMMRY